MNAILSQSKLYSKLLKIFPLEIAKHHIEILFAIDDELMWFKPTNKHSEEYTICQTLFEHGLIAKKDIPLYKDGSFVGFQTSFLFDLDLLFIL